MTLGDDIRPGTVVRFFWRRSHNDRIHCEGFQSFVVLAIGHKWIELLYPPACRRVKVKRDMLEHFTPLDSPKTAEYLRKRLAYQIALGHQVSVIGTNQAIDLLTQHTGASCNAN